jgi:transposase
MAARKAKTERKKTGRKTKLTRDVLKRAVELKEGGANNVDICAAIGIHESTFYAWVNDPKTDLQREFSDAIKRAEADYKNALLAIVMRDAQEKDWKAAAWLLERKYPSEYARTDRVQAEVKQETNASVRVEHYFDYGE